MSRPYLYCPHCAGALTPSTTGRALTRCPSCGFAQYDNPVPVVSAVVEHDGRVVLARNKARDYASRQSSAGLPRLRRGRPPTWYALVAGFLERDEAPDDALRREVKEELGLDALSTHLIGVYPFQRMNQVIMAYHVTATGPITLNDELVDYKLVEPAHCTAWRAGTGFALRDWLRSPPAKGGPAQHCLARGEASRSEPRMTDRPGEGDIEVPR